LEGKLTHRKYTDKNGIDRYTTEVVAAMVRNLEKSKSDGVGTYFPSQEPPTKEGETSPNGFLANLDEPMTQDVPFEVIAPSSNIADSAPTIGTPQVNPEGLPF
jgi:single-stranded DNA-binding protein